MGGVNIQCGQLMYRLAAQSSAEAWIRVLGAPALTEWAKSLMLPLSSSTWV
jgi:hypothetical protein